MHTRIHVKTPKGIPTLIASDFAHKNAPAILEECKSWPSSDYKMFTEAQQQQLLR